MCPCIVEPTSESCVNIPMSALSQIMISLSTAIRTKPNLTSNLKQCTCELHAKYQNFEKHFAKRPEDIIQLTACDRSAQPDLICQNKAPKLHHPNCVNGVCNLCSADNVDINKCPVCSGCNEVLKCILWDKAERACGKTQLEPFEHDLQINEICQHLMSCAKTGRNSMVLGQWSDHVKKLIIMRIIWTQQ